MKHFLSQILVFISICSPTIFTQDYYSTIAINEIEIFFEEGNWDIILDEYWSDGNKERLKCSLIINGTQFDNVGVRYKGFSSYKRNFLKKPLNIKLDYIEDQSYHGIKTFKLSNGFRDPTLIREVLAYEIFRKYMPASRTSFAVVSINGNNKGLYTSVENIDKTFLSNHYRNNNGAFFKGAPQRIRGSLIGKANFEFLGNDSSTYFSSYELKSDFGWNELVDLCSVLNNDVESIENIFNVDQALWLIALNNVIVNLDSPINVNRNFYLYKDSSDKFNILPWDLNMTFGTFKSISGFNGFVTSNTLQTFDPLFNIGNSKFPLLSKILQVPKYRNIYLAHMKTILKENFENGWYLERAKELQAIIASHAVTDKNKFYTNEDFWNNLESTIGNDVIFTIGVADLMNARMDFLNSHNVFQPNQPSILDIKITPNLIIPNSDIYISCSVSDAEKVIFAYKSSIGERFKKIPMTRNPNSGNNDQIEYELPLTIGAGELQYYIYAENENTAIFSPERSEYKYHVIPVSGKLVINEILASNDSSASDDEGEYDDFIELYNNSDFTISLENYYLSDKSGNLEKWIFPDVEIFPNDYLVIWADEDSSKSSLHTNFKLSATGEDLFLSNSEGVLIEKVSFGKQSSDISYGRFPDGTGKFNFMLPSLAYSNINPSTFTNTLIAKNVVLEQNYPNPFNPTTNIQYSIPMVEQSEVTVHLKIYDILGREVTTLVNKNQGPGNYEISFDGSNLASGIYFYNLRVNSSERGKINSTITRKMLRIK